MDRSIHLRGSQKFATKEERFAELVKLLVAENWYRAKAHALSKAASEVVDEILDNATSPKSTRAEVDRVDRMASTVDFDTDADVTFPETKTFRSAVDSVNVARRGWWKK